MYKSLNDNHGINVPTLTIAARLRSTNDKLTWSRWDAGCLGSATARKLKSKGRRHISTKTWVLRDVFLRTYVMV